MSLPSVKREFLRIDPIDFVYAALRCAAFGIGVAYAYATHGPGTRAELLTAFGVFAAYSATAYAVALGDVARLRPKLYVWLESLDLLFVVYLMHLSGGGISPFYRALYLWVAMVAFRSGLRAGTIASAIAFGVFVSFFGGAPDALDLAVKAAGLLLHGPMIGYLVQRDRAK